jgi:osmotically-inducible protein OsmY
MAKDRNLQKAVLAQLAWDRRVGAAHIEAEAESRVVTLGGHVLRLVARYAAESAASRAAGVRAIVGALEV